MKYQVMIKILMLLLARKKVTAVEIAEKYEISVRSIYRYVEELCIAGIPIDIARGRYGGLSIADTFKLPVGYFTKEEYNSTINALNAMLSQVSDENARLALEKLQRQIKNERRNLSVSGNIIIDGGAWCDVKRFSDKMSVCEKAVNESLQLSIDYISRSGEHSKRVIDPHVLIYKGNVWYVYAYCHNKQEFRTFKIGRIKDASFTGHSFEKKKLTREDIPLNFTKDTANSVDVVLEISPSVLPDVEEWLGVDEVEPRKNGFYAEINLPLDSGLVNKILSFGGGVKVVAPENLKTQVKDAAKKILEG